MAALDGAANVLQCIITVTVIMIIITTTIISHSAILQWYYRALSCIENR